MIGEIAENIGLDAYKEAMNTEKLCDHCGDSEWEVLCFIKNVDVTCHLCLYCYYIFLKRSDVVTRFLCSKK